MNLKERFMMSTRTTKDKVILFLKKIIKSPKTSLIFGILLLVSGIFEAFDTAIEKFFDFHIRLHHGIILFALFHIILALNDVIEGVDYTKDSKREEKERKFMKTEKFCTSIHYNENTQKEQVK